MPPNVRLRSPFGGAPAGLPIRFPWRSVLLLAALSLLPRLWLSVTRAIDYDGYWHVFVAGQDRWENFIAGVWSNAHPPLFYLLLRGAMAFGRTELSFRLVSLLAGLGAVIAGARLAWRVGRNATVAVWAAAAFASCFAPVVLSCEVRSYMLALFFILVSFGGYLELLDGSESHRSARATAVFAGGACAAVCSHYFAFLYLLACLLLTAVVATVNPAVRARAWHRARSDRGSLAWWGALLALVGGLALVHAAYRAPRLNHLALYMFEPGGREPLTRFLARNLVAEFNLFSPLALATDAPSSAAVGLAAALALAGVWWLRKLRRADRVAALLPAGGFLTILLLITGASAAGRYPFGGAMRQQSILFPFLVLSASGLAAGVFSKLATVPRALCGIVLFLGLAVNSARQLPTYESYYPASFAEADRTLTRSFPETKLLYTDQFGVVAFFSRRFEWDWSYRLRVPGDPELLWYRIRRGRETLDVVEDRARWVARLDATPLYRSLRSALRVASSRCLVVYRLVPSEGAGFGADEPKERIERAARAAGLRLGREVQFGSNRLLEVCLPEPALPASVGRGGEPAAIP